MKLTLGFSPCPNDTFMFDALVHHKVDTEGLEFELHMTDVEELNQMAFHDKLDFTKVSFHAYLFLARNYILLDSGSALGFGSGPLLIAKRKIEESEIDSMTIAIPGKYTTANLLFSMAYPGCRNKLEMVISGIEQAILDEKVDGGVIIHENRFTYEDKGLIKITDLGEYWEKLTGEPIPLGGIVAKRNLPVSIIDRFSRSLLRSIEYAFENPDLNEFIRCNAQEMSDEVMLKHIELYVNELSRSLGKRGRDAIKTLFRVAAENGIIDTLPGEIFFKTK
jgi:1,4-dihydroxy-6-naphthoate synthase